MPFGCLPILSMRSTSFVVTLPSVPSQRTRGFSPIFSTISLSLSQACSLPSRANLILYVFTRCRRLAVNSEYQVYSPFQRQWSSVINADVDKYLAEAAAPSANSPSVKNHSPFKKLFASEIPSHIEGFQYSDNDKMAVVWPAGTDAAREVCLVLIERILYLIRGNKDAAPFSPHKVPGYPFGLG